MDLLHAHLPLGWTLSKTHHLNLSFAEIRHHGQVELTVPFRHYGTNALSKAVAELENRRNPAWLRRRRAADALRSH